ncbi:MAG TPA: hypothetical protein VHQ47_08575, partial [Phycisphaerae bacterium]|nr:hypothetical protein [Phycisphaerae bacterium]
PLPPPTSAPLKYIDAPGKSPRPSRARTKDAPILRGLKDLQKLQQQTVAVLEAVKSALDDIGAVLRSPEATRGMEKQRNAAALLTKGFARDAVDQATGAVELLPANPEAHLLLALSLAADQQFDPALAATRKGLALFDRRQHPLAIEAGLLHALAALGAPAEAADRWASIIDALPLAVLLEHLPRIIACYPTDAPPHQLDDLLVRRLNRPDPLAGASPRAAFAQLPAPALLAGIDAAHDGIAGGGRLPETYRAILAQVARRLKAGAEASDVLRFFSECLVPLGGANRPGREDSVAALARAGVKRLVRLHADAMLLHRAMAKLELAGADKSANDLARLLNHWRCDASTARRVRDSLLLAMGLGAAGTLFLALVVLAHGPVTLVWIGPALMVAAMFTAAFALMVRTRHIELPANRPPLTPEELRYLRSPAVKASLKPRLKP